MTYSQKTLVSIGKTLKSISLTPQVTVTLESERVLNMADDDSVVDAFEGLCHKRVLFYKKHCLWVKYP